MSSGNEIFASQGIGRVCLIGAIVCEAGIISQSCGQSKSSLAVLRLALISTTTVV